MTLPSVRKRGRPPGSINKKKTPLPPKAARLKKKLRANPEDANIQYIRMFSDLGAHAIYGVDEFTEALIDALWKDPQAAQIYCSDPNPDKLAYINRKIGGRSFSIYRWFAVSTSDFFEQPMTHAIVVSKQHYEEAVRRNVHGLELIVLEDL